MFVQQQQQQQQSTLDHGEVCSCASAHLQALLTITAAAIAAIVTELGHNLGLHHDVTFSDVGYSGQADGWVPVSFF
jgi:hypothetical protein